MGSVVVVLELSCPRACGISAPRTGIKLESPALQGRFLTTGPPGKSLKSELLKRKLLDAVIENVCVCVCVC